MQDAGIYECIATSSRGTVSQRIQIQVKGKWLDFLEEKQFNKN